MAHSGPAQQHNTHAAPSVDCGAGGPAAKRPRVEDVLQQHAPREQLLVSELMGWRSCSQDPTAAAGGVGSTAGGGAAPTGSTDFRALFARQNSQQLQAQQRAPPDRAPPDSAATAGLRTFADVATRPAAAPEDVGRQNVLGAMRVVYNTASAATCSGLGRSASEQGWTVLEISGVGGAPTVDGFGPIGGAAAGAAGAGVAGAALEDLQPQQLPVDWGIKRAITFTSTARFAVHDRAQQAPPSTRWRATQNAINCDLESCREEVVRYLACQVSWRHPELPLDSAALGAARSASAAAGTAVAGWTSGTPAAGLGATSSCSNNNLLAQRLAAWRNALHSLYGMYRGGDCHVFYVINSAPRNPFVVLFTYKGVRGCGDLCGVVSQSSRLLRGRMLAAGVPFTMPLERASAAGGSTSAGGGSGKAGYEAAPSGAAESDERGDADLVDEGAQARTTGTTVQAPGSTAQDNSRESLLLLRGPRAVHGLYDFLMNDVSYSGQGGRAVAGGAAGPNEELSDLPTLLAPAPFEGGAIWRPTMKALTMSSRTAGDALSASSAAPLAAPLASTGAASGDPADAVLHVLQVSGPLPPWTVRRLCAALAQLHVGYSAALEAEPCSIPVNSRVLEAPVGEGTGEGEEGGARSRAQQQQQLQTMFAHGGALSVEELAAWRQPVALPGGRPVKGVACSGASRLSLRL